MSKRKTLFETPEAITALLEEKIEEMMTDGTLFKAGDGVAPPLFSQMRFKDGVGVQAADATELLPAIPKPALGLKLADYRVICQHSINLAEGGEGLFGNFVEQMVESVAQGFENRLATTDLADIGANPQDQQQPGGGAPAAPGAPGAPAKPVKGPKSTPGQPGGKTPTQQENFVGIFDTFCRTVNSDANGRSIPGRVRGMDALLGQWVYHYWTTSLMVVLYRWGSVRVPELNYRPIQMPVEMEFLDPLRINLDNHKSMGVVWYELPSLDKTRLINEVQQTYGGNPQLHPFFAMYPVQDSGNVPTQLVPVNPNVPQNVYSANEAFRELQQRSRVPLPPNNVKVYKRTYNSSQTYPMPFASRIFAPVNDKRMLRQMDRSLVRKVIMMILQVAVASPDPKRPVREPDLVKTKERIEEQLISDPEYLQILTTPADTKISWIIPEHTAIFDRAKYNTVDFEILAALVGLISNQLLNTSGTLDMTLIGKTLFQKNQKCLFDFKRFLEEIYDEIVSTNNLRAIRPSDVNIVFKQISLYESDAFKVFIYNMVTKGMLPAKIAIEHMGEDYDSAVEQLVKEEQLRQKYNIFLTPPTNMQGVYPGYGTDPSNPDAAPPGQPGQPPKPGQPADPNAPTNPGASPKTPSGPGGRPPGSTDTQPRQPKS